MIKNSLLQIRIDNDLRNNAVALFDEMGMDITSAIRLFLKQTLSEQSRLLTPHCSRIRNN